MRLSIVSSPKAEGASPPRRRAHPPVVLDQVEHLASLDPLPARVRLDGFVYHVHRRPRDAQPVLIQREGERVYAPPPTTRPGRRMRTLRLDEPLRMVLIGDTGRGNRTQRKVAEAMRAFASEFRPHFGVNLGDVVYPHGLEGPDDPRIQRDIVEPYRGTVFHYVYGNHDYGDSKGAGDPDALVDYANSNAFDEVEMPAAYYSRRVETPHGSVLNLFLDTNVIATQDEAQRAWLLRELRRADEDYVLVFGHHPLFSGGDHGDQPHLQALLLEPFEQHVDLYAAGHDHSQQVLVSEGGLTQLVSGSGSEGEAADATPESVFGSKEKGFTALTLDENGLRLQLISAQTGEVLYQHDVPPRRTRQAPAPAVGG